MLDQMITHERVITSSNADFLAGSQLDQPGVPGVYTIWAVSDQVDTTISVSLGGRTIVDAATVVQRAAQEIRVDEDVMFQMLSRTGGRPVIAIVEVTAAIMRIRVVFIPAFAT